MMSRLYFALTVIVLICISGCFSDSVSVSTPLEAGTDLNRTSHESPLSPAQALETFHLADDDLVIELVAAEPAVCSPVGMAWDAEGRLFVAEMSDYPIGPEKGRIRLLEDRNQDGQYEHSSVFAAEVPFPTSVLPARDGLLVTAAPDILFLRDTNGDAKVDEQQVLFTGFGQGNQQLRVNGLVTGTDGWVWGANGRSNGVIERSNRPEVTPVHLAGGDFRFKSDGSAFERVAGGSQFGLGRDDWGERFASWNTIVIRHVLLPQSAIDVAPHLAPLSVRDIADPADNTAVFPTSPPPQTFNQEVAGNYNALCGLTIFRGSELGDQYKGNAFVCESLRSLVHRRKLDVDGPTFISRRADSETEFLSSSDSWFHPVYIATGPDGNLYIADFYRRWVEHPEWVADRGARATTNWSEGAEHGRIWRIRRKVAPPSELPTRLATLTDLDLIPLLASQNSWQRDTAERLLTERLLSERAESTTTESLRTIVQYHSSPFSRFHALSTLAATNRLDINTLGRALQDSQPQIRRHALRLWPLMHPEEAPLTTIAMGLAKDPSPAVRFQLALALQSRPDDDKLNAILEIARHDPSRWDDMLAVQVALGRSAWTFIENVSTKTPQFLTEATADQLSFLENIGRLAGQNNDLDELGGIFRLLNSVCETRIPLGALAFVSGLAQGLSDCGTELRELRGEQITGAAATITAFVIQAVDLAQSDASPVSQRLMALRFLRNVAVSAELTPLLRLLASDQEVPVANSAAETLLPLTDESQAKAVFEAWESYAVSTRRILITCVPQSTAAINALASAISDDTVSSLEVDATVRLSLSNSPHRDEAQRLLTLLASTAPADRNDVLARYSTATELPGSREHGGTLVARHCLSCHQIHGRGRSIGPNLTAVGSHPKSQLLISLLDPSRQVSPDYRAYTAITTNGQVLSGLLASETARSITLRRPDGDDLILSRDHLDQLRPNGKSLMPDGFEQKLSVQDIADVLSFLSNPDVTLLPVE